MTHKLGDKIPTALVRDPNNRAKVLPEITPGCEWVFAGEGVPTRKWDGTCVMLDAQGQWWARREVKPGKNPPPNYESVHFDPITGKFQGWEPIEQSSFAKFHEEALVGSTSLNWTEGTYELVGPKINGGRDGFPQHTLLKHSEAPEIPDLAGVRDVVHVANVLIYMEELLGYEGVVWHHPDGRMAKLKGRDL